MFPFILGSFSALRQAQAVLGSTATYILVLIINLRTSVPKALSTYVCGRIPDRVKSRNSGGLGGKNEQPYCAGPVLVCI